MPDPTTIAGEQAAITVATSDDRPGWVYLRVGDDGTCGTWLARHQAVALTRLLQAATSS